MSRIAVVGAGVSGLVAARLLSRRHEVVVYEAASHVGGHTHTVDVSRPSGDYRIDTGFIVCNDRTYPNFLTLLSQLGITPQPTSMGFAVRCEQSGLEYCGAGLNGLFAQRRNLFSPGHWSMLLEILRFNRSAPALLASAEGEQPLGQWLHDHGYSARFLRYYILAMGGAIWSCGEQQMAAFPARFFVSFFVNHGLLELRNRPQWYVIPGGSRTYVDKLLATMPATVKPSTPVLGISRNGSGGGEGVTIRLSDGLEVFDQVVVACHSDQALALLEDPDANESNVLAGITYQPNEVVLHTDENLMPRQHRAWSSWNALLPQQPEQLVQVTYNMNILQGIDAPEQFLVTLNGSERIDPASIIGRWEFSHPLFTPEGIGARAQIAAINGTRNTWFCGAWCGNGFHEDGVVSALEVARHFGEVL